MLAKWSFIKDDVNSAMASVGFVWHYKKYQREQLSGDQLLYATAEEDARSLSLGLWGAASRIAP